MSTPWPFFSIYNLIYSLSCLWVGYICYFIFDGSLWYLISQTLIIFWVAHVFLKNSPTS